MDIMNETDRVVFSGIGKSLLECITRYQNTEFPI